MPGEARGGPASGIPARNYTWQPFEPGHTASLKHGANSPRVVGPLAERLAAGLADDAPWTAGAAHVATVTAWSWAEAQASVLRAWLDEHGVIDDEGKPRPAAAFLDQVEKRAANLRAELGLTPLALAKLLTAVSGLTSEAATAGLDALRAEGRRIVEARAAALEAPSSAQDHVSGPPPPVEGDDAGAGQ
jgi:hypothetical protein